MCVLGSVAREAVINCSKHCDKCMYNFTSLLQGLHRVISGVKTTFLDPASEFLSTQLPTVMKPAPSQPVSAKRGLQLLNFYTNEMPFHRPANGFLRQEASN